MRKWLHILFGASGLFALLAAALFWRLLPPKIKAPDQQDRIISNITIWNPGGAPGENQSIVISDGLITDIRATKADDPEPLCNNCYVMPGLIDAHIHTPPKLAIGNQRLFSLLYLQYGVTTVRDLGQLDDSLPILMRNIDTGKFPGPRMYRCGPVLDGTPASFQGALSIQTATEATQTVATLAAEGVSCIKTYDRLPAEAFIAASKEAKKRGLPLMGHTPHSVKLTDIDNFEIAHFTGVPYLEDAPPEGRAYLSQDLIDMTDEDVADVIALMKQNNLSILPTNANTLARLTISAPQRFPATQGLRHLPAFWQRAWPGIVSHPETEAEIEAELMASPVGLAFMQRARNAGIDVLAGTDVIMPYVIPGESLHLQLGLMADAFESEEIALIAATQINGKHVDNGKVGRINVGAYADLIIFRNDPRQNLSRVRDWSFLITNGRLYTRADIDEAVARYNRHFNGVIYSSVMNFAYSLLSDDYRHTSGETE